MSCAIHGRPLVDWVIKALNHSCRIGSIVAIGPDQLDSLLCARLLRQRLDYPTLFAKKSNETALTWGSEGGFFITVGSAVLLTPPIIDNALNAFLQPAMVPTLPIIHSPKNCPALVMASAFALCWRSEDIVTTIQMLLSAHAHHIKPQFIKPLSTPLSQPHRFIRFWEADGAFIVNNEQTRRAASKRLPPPPESRYKRVALVVNPQAGIGMRANWFMSHVMGFRRTTLTGHSPSPDTAQGLCELLQQQGIRAEPRQTHSATEALTAAQEYARKRYDVVIAAGGDGAINAIVNGIANTTTALGVIPLGTANVFALQMNIPPDVRSACQLIAEGAVRRIDLGKVNNRFFASVAGVGFDAMVMRQTERGWMKRRLGGLGYIAQAVLLLARYRFKPIHFTTQAGKRHRAYFLLIGNGKYYGGSLRIASAADINDGKLDIVAFTSKRLRDWPRYVIGMLHGTLGNDAPIEYLQERSIVIERTGLHSIELDGEIEGTTPALVSAQPGALRVIC
jgi:YegS/Rv2252/BmrU family lipid kinase